jgi:hypothetical protein
VHWTFGKTHERITIRRSSDSPVLVVEPPGDQTREYSFADPSALDSFQADMEAFLLKTGWTLETYSPERRRGRDRRGFPRLRERRRWWTDSAELWKRVWPDQRG